VGKNTELFFNVKAVYIPIAISVGRDSSVGIVTRYGMECLGIESQWGRDFPHPSRPTLGPTQPPIQYRVFPGSKAAGVLC